MAVEDAVPALGAGDMNVHAEVVVVGGAQPALATRPPVPAQPAAPLLAAQLQSEKVVVAAPMSFAGSAARIWKLTRMRSEPWEQALLGALACVLILGAWVVVLAWYGFFGLLLVPYRVVRRGSRKRKRQALQHREMLAAIQSQQDRG
jgi:hypothetical protein